MKKDISQSSSARQFVWKNRKQAFTLIEMLVVIVIFFILLGLGLVSYESLKIDNALNATSSELASTIRHARSLALQQQIPHQVIFDTTRKDKLPPSASSDANFYRFLYGKSDDHDGFIEYQNEYQSDNLSGKDQWYAIVRSFKWGSNYRNWSTGLSDEWRPPASRHMYTSQTGSRFDEAQYDRNRLQVGPRRYLLAGVRFWRTNVDDSWVDGGGDITDIYNRVHVEGSEKQKVYNWRRADGRTFSRNLRFITGDNNNPHYFYWGSPMNSFMLKSTTSLRTLNFSCDSDTPSQHDVITALPSGELGLAVKVIRDLKDYTGSNTNRWYGREIPLALQSRRLRFDVPSPNNSNPNGIDSKILGLVWHEDRTKHRFLRISSDGSVLIRREIPWFYD